MADQACYNAVQVAAEEFLSTPADPVAPFSSPISKHMNEDHASSTLAIVKHFVPLDIDISAAKLQTLDRLGMEVECSSTEGPFTCRVPFTRHALLACHSRDRENFHDVQPVELAGPKVQQSYPCAAGLLLPRLALPSDNAQCLTAVHAPAIWPDDCFGESLQVESNPIVLGPKRRL